MSLLDAFQYVGDSLDKATGSRALRGVLGGKPRELLSVVPFSDRLGLTDERDITSGRQLTDAYGITSRSDKGWGAWGAGLAADLALDPSNLIGGAALRKLGKFDFGRQADDLGRAGRSGSDFSLGLKYDAPRMLPGDVGLRRSDPEWVNNRTFYHGTGDTDLLSSSIDPARTQHGLFGRGVYTTDEWSSRPDTPITEGYARDRFRNAQPVSGGSARAGLPTIYQSQSDFGKILELDAPLGSGLGREFLRLARDPFASLGDGYDHVGQIPDVGLKSIGDLVKWLTMTTWPMNARASDAATPFIRAMKQSGYDAMTHTGGVNYGRPYHQVVIGLDPNDYQGVGRATPYKSWEPYKTLLPDAATDYSLGGPARHPLSPKRNQMFDPFPGESEALNRAAMALGPQYPGGADRLLELLDRAGAEAGVRDYAKQHIDYAKANLDPDTMGRIASEIPEDASPLSMGYESVVFAAPDGRVIRVGNDRYGAIDGVPQGRPDLAAMLQPVRSANFGPYQVEHLNRVTPLDTGGHALDQEKDLVRQFLDTEARAANLYPSDTGFRNLGLTDHGRALAIDGGAFGAPFAPYNRSQVYRPPTLEYPTASQVRELLAMGAPDAVREAIARGIGLRAANQGVDVPGGPDLLARIRELAGMPPVASPTRPSPAVGNRPIDLGALMGGGSDFSLAASPPMPAVGRVGSPSSIRDLLAGTTIHRNVDLSPRQLAGMGVPRGATGWYKPSTDAIVQLASSPNPGGTRRHEMAHAMVANANRAGSAAALPMALKPSAWLRQAGYTPAGRWLEELAAAGLSQRGTSSQLLAALGAATDGPMMNAYADVIGAGPGLRSAMGVAPALWRNRVPLGIGALSLNELSMLANSLGREE